MLGLLGVNAAFSMVSRVFFVYLTLKMMDTARNRPTRTPRPKIAKYIITI